MIRSPLLHWYGDIKRSAAFKPAALRAYASSRSSQCTKAALEVRLGFFMAKPKVLNYATRRMASTTGYRLEPQSQFPADGPSYNPSE